MTPNLFKISKKNIAPPKMTKISNATKNPFPKETKAACGTIRQ
ncbi:MAG: hypothetical protein UX26_C0007G0019 [Parcubacteria group bacterium GW2011_GWC1_45_9]|nr:MAG: hypothetical protein UX26_C0007G0019 [Parcubacteria group bacterium GW2011_GWC1_45_9]